MSDVAMGFLLRSMGEVAAGSARALPPVRGAERSPGLLGARPGDAGCRACLIGKRRAESANPSKNVFDQKVMRELIAPSKSGSLRRGLTGRESPATNVAGCG
jgi:hypothetical protein